DESVLAYRPGLGRFDTSGDTTDFDERLYSAAPANLKSTIENYKFKPAFALGFAYAWKEAINVSADLQPQLGKAVLMLIGPKTSRGVGAEYRGIRFLSLRGGADYITGGSAFSVGAGIHFGKYEMGAAFASQQGDNKGTSVMLNLFSIH